MKKNNKEKLFKSAYSETTYMLRKMEEAKKFALLKEEEFKYPNMENDIKEDIEGFKQNLPDYIIKINPQYKFYKDNVICYGQATIKSTDFGFSFSLDEEGCLILFKNLDSNTMPLYNELVQFFVDLKAYYSVWKKKWTEKLNNIGGVTNET